MICIATGSVQTQGFQIFLDTERKKMVDERWRNPPSNRRILNNSKGKPESWPRLLLLVKGWGFSKSSSSEEVPPQVFSVLKRTL